MMNESNVNRPPYTWALVVAAGVLGLYLVTLAPTTQLWDASEYITAAHALGIPHPPGSPLFVLLAHVWGLIPLARDYGARINIFAAVTSAAAAGFWFLIGDSWLRTIIPSNLPRRLAAFAGTLVGATAFSVWNQSVVNEKVYTVSLLSVVLVLWIALRWSETPAEQRSERPLLVIAYLLVLTSANHLMGVLAAPAVLVLVLLTEPRVLVRPRFLLALLGVVVVAASAYLFMPIRAHLDPYLNEGSPTTWPALHDVLTRAQFGKPSLLDNPMYPAGALNPGRSLQLFGQQILNFVQYFTWQWGRDWPVQVQGLLALLFGGLGIAGARRHWRSDRRSAAAMTALLGTLTLLLVFYLNFKWGYSQPYDTPGLAHEVRERDYFFIVSFSAWGVWVGIGLAAIGEWLARARPPATRPVGVVRWAVAAPVLLLALIPFAGNRESASRRGETLARDYATDVLQSADPYAVIVTAGDNDTFPLWYAQEVDGVRRDVTVLVTSLGNLGWYLRQMNDRPLATFDSSAAPALYRGRAWPKPTTPWLANCYRAESDTLPEYAPLEHPLAGRLGPLDVSIDPAQLPIPGYLSRVDLAILEIVKQQAGKRPIYFSGTTANYADQLGLGAYLVTEGMLRRLTAAPVTPGDSIQASQVQRRLVNVPRTTRLAFEVYHGASAARARPKGWVDRASENSLLPYILTYDTLAELLHDSDPAKAARALQLARAVLANTDYPFDLTPPRPTRPTAPTAR
jgi:hypothetical protein